MLIQVDTDRTVENDERLVAMVEAEVNSTLGRFEERLTRVEAHLSEEAGAKKSTGAEVRCLLEARPAKHQPVVVKGSGDSLEHACKDATRKMQAVLTTTFGRIGDRNADATIRTAETTDTAIPAVDEA
jgi:hypothetical protein